MNRVVKEVIAVERLPEELRGDFAAGEIVEVEVRSLGGVEERAPGEERPGDDVPITLEAWLREVDEQEPGSPPLPPEEVERRGAVWDRFFGAHAHRNTSIEEAVARIRTLRDEDD